jgi:GNAT superfamily N-acetyltransferase
MPLLPQGLTHEQIARAIEENAAEFLLALGRAAGSEERDDGTVHWSIGGSPVDYHNCVVRADLTDETADQAIIESRELLRNYGVPGTWHVGPSMRPADLGVRLVAHGFHDDGPESGMAVDLRMLPDTVDAPASLQIERVRDVDTLAAWIDTLGQGFGEGPAEAAWVGAMYARIGLGDQSPCRHYLGFLDGIPVATASLFLGAGVAGVYFVMTLPQAQRKGIGAAITLSAFQDASGLGYQLGVLGASEQGYPVYQRLGFREYCTISLYSWKP